MPVPDNPKRPRRRWAAVLLLLPVGALVLLSLRGGTPTASLTGKVTLYNLTTHKHDLVVSGQLTVYDAVGSGAVTCPVRSDGTYLARGLNTSLVRVTVDVREVEIRDAKYPHANPFVLIGKEARNGEIPRGYRAIDTSPLIFAVQPGENTRDLELLPLGELGFPSR
jgi:hypothetical protein